ncbi:MAG: DUF2063 domain-containing protein [Alphaproteobacteria bacterium]|nr:MAG: DUF2063 domain-containing protein [Alphaproteobacteria bacterium]
MVEATNHSSFFDTFTAKLRSPEPSDQSGVNVYRNNSRAAFLRVLEETFPIVRKLVGEEFFRFLAHEFYGAHPANSPWVHLYGKPMPKFLETFEPVKHLAYLPDVARLEILWLETYHAEDTAPLSAEVLQSELASDTGLAATVKLHPSLRLLASEHPVATLWQHNKVSDSPLKLTSEGEHIILVRPETAVGVLTVSPALFKAVQLIQNNQSLESVILASADKDPQQHLTEVFRLLIQHQLVISVEKKND